jgi:hypothetical protein
MDQRVKNEPQGASINKPFIDTLYKTKYNGIRLRLIFMNGEIK